jgi:hypothetical protein
MNENAKRMNQSDLEEDSHSLAASATELYSSSAAEFRSMENVKKRVTNVIGATAEERNSHRSVLTELRQGASVTRRVRNESKTELSYPTGEIVTRGVLVSESRIHWYDIR